MNTTGNQLYQTIDKFDRAVGGLLDGNNIHTKPTTIEEVEKLSGEAETFIIQTIRDEEGDHVVVKFVDKDGVKRLILPPKVVNTIVRQRDALATKLRRNHSKAAMKARMAAGYKPMPPRRKKSV
jgi:hypothetical protein